MKADPAPDGSGDSLSGFWEHYRRNCGSVADIDNEVGIEAGVLGVNVAKRIADHAAVSDHVVGSGVDMPWNQYLMLGWARMKPSRSLAKAAARTSSLDFSGTESKEGA